MLNLKDILFNEASVLEFFSQNDRFYLKLEHTRYQKKTISLELSISDVFKMLRNSGTVNALSMPAEDGEVIDAKVYDDHFLIIIEWNDFANNKQHTDSYRIYGKKITAHECS